MYEPRQDVVDGMVSIPAGPGWGGDLSRLAVEIRAPFEHARLKLWPACPACTS